MRLHLQITRERLLSKDFVLSRRLENFEKCNTEKFGPLTDSSSFFTQRQFSVFIPLVLNLNVSLRFSYFKLNSFGLINIVQHHFHILHIDAYNCIVRKPKNIHNLNLTLQVMRFPTNNLSV